jgi:hypothetical protein
LQKFLGVETKFNNLIAYGLIRVWELEPQSCISCAISLWAILVGPKLKIKCKK